MRLRPEQVADLLLRTGPHGDRFGLRRGGLSLKKLRAHPHGMVLGEHVATGVLPDKLRTAGRRVRLAPPEIRAEVERLGSANGDDPAFPLRLIGMRELRSHNSWMHNSPLLMRGGRVQALRIHPDDAAAYGLEDGAAARLESKDGALDGAGEGHRRADPGHGRAPARVGSSGRLAAGEPPRRGQREPARRAAARRTSSRWRGWPS